MIAYYDANVIKNNDNSNDDDNYHDYQNQISNIRLYTLCTEGFVKKVQNLSHYELEH